MALARPPDWLIYAGAVFALAALAASAQDRASAPAAPPPVPSDEMALPADGVSIDPAKAKPLPAAAEARTTGTAFSVLQSGVWLTARHVVRGCTHLAVLVSPGRGVLARATLDPVSDLAVLVTAGGAPPLSFASDRRSDAGQTGFLPGYPHGLPGEVAARLLGPYVLGGAGRQGPPQRVLAWAEIGRTDGLNGSLAGLSGAPVVDASGQVVGVALAEAPRRGRIYAAPLPAIRAALARAGRQAATSPPGQPITTDNYGRAADALRRELSVAEVACLN